jgi:inner membrane protein
MCHLMLVLPLVALPVFWWLPIGDAIGVYVIVLVATGTVYWLAVQAMRAPVTVGIETLLRKVGTVRTAQDRRGAVWVASELWSAESRDTPLAIGERVEVVGFDGLRLIVRRVEPEPRADARSQLTAS